MLLSKAAENMQGRAVGECCFDGFAIDSRHVKPGNMFVCILGEHTDGHKYIKNAEENGASCLLCEHEVETDLPYIIVSSSVKGLQLLANSYRAALDVTVVAVTGSVGKTTTKECIYSVLKEKYKTHKTDGNKNSETGLPRTLLEISPDDEYAVVEMGMSARGEIEVLSLTAQPDIAVITNIGHSHIEFLGTRENILQAKLEIITGLKKDGILILNFDDEYLNRGYEEYLKDKITQRIIRYGIENINCDIYAQDIVMEDGYLRFFVHTPVGETTVVMPCEGIHNVYNALAAVSVAVCAEVPFDLICKGLSSFKNAPMRQQSYEKDGFFIIEDCYNASPASMKASIDVLKNRKGKGRKIAVLGDMKELGEMSQLLHEETGKMLNGIDIFIAFGTYNDAYIKGAVFAGLPSSSCFSCENAEQAGIMLKKIATEGDCILVKSSRSMGGENVLKTFFD